MQAILQKISIGTDITDDEQTMVIDLIKEYPDIFALNLSEVFPVDFMMHKLKLDPDIVLLRKVHQRAAMKILLGHYRQYGEGRSHPRSTS